jgi:hypothetical protein
MDIRYIAKDFKFTFVIRDEDKTWVERHDFAKALWSKFAAEGDALTLGDYRYSFRVTKAAAEELNELFVGGYFHPEEFPGLHAFWPLITIPQSDIQLSTFVRDFPKIEDGEFH